MAAQNPQQDVVVYAIEVFGYIYFQVVPFFSVWLAVYVDLFIILCYTSIKKKQSDKLIFCEGGVSMKKIGLGIAILLFAIIISLCSSGMGLLVIGIGIVGLIFSIIGFIENK